MTKQSYIFIVKTSLIGHAVYIKLTQDKQMAHFDVTKRQRV